MDWDDDIDIGIDEDKSVAFFESLDSISNIRYVECIEEWTGKPFYKIWDYSGEKIEGCDYTFPFIDIWLYCKKEEDLVFKNGIVCKNSASKPFVKIEFEGASFYLPHNSLDVLDSRYTRWRTNILVYTWSHRLEQNAFKPLSVPIVTDKTGKMIKLGR